jgi:ComEC/Rec2-related protein
LFTGVVLGDDREQDTAEVEDFRAAGLTHLLAVSGQNLAFVLTLAAPISRRLGDRGRLVMAASLLLVFGAVTRWEPSVIRAVAMAMVAVWATTQGRPTGTRRALPLAVAVLLLVDPLLVRSVGFLLSVGASSGIALLASRLERALPTSLAVTLAAQAGVAPVLLPVFGALPLVAVPANLLALPAAGPLMMWGLAAGLPAGLVGGPAARVLHVPSHVLLWWIAGVARVSASLPVGRLTPTTAVVVVLAGLVAWSLAALARRRSTRRTSDATDGSRPPVRSAVRVGTAALAAIAARPLVVHPVVQAASLDTGMGSDRLWRRDGHAVVVTDGRAPPGRLLAALRAQQVPAVDVLVATSRSTTAGIAVGVVAERLPIGVVLAPPDRRYGAGRTPTVGMRPGTAVRAGPFTVLVRDGATVKNDAVRQRVQAVQVQVGSPRAARARSP